MTRVVLDTNVIVSALLKPAGNEALVLLLALRGRLSLCVSPAVLAEYEDVLHNRPHLRFRPGEVEATLKAIRKAAELVEPTETLRLSDDDSDNRFYECADKASADYIVTGNKRHFQKSYKNIRAVNARQVLELLSAE